MMNNKLIKEVISDRHSVRSYNDNQLSKDIIDKIENYITNLTNPFDRKVKIKLIRKHTGSESIKLGTYGVIKGAEYFLVAACKKDELSKDDFSTPLTKDDAKEFFEPLEMIRLAPSSVNKQPWRVIKENNEIHFYFANSKNSTIIDMGIALCHFHLTAMENNLEGEFVVNDPKKENKNLTYIISWVQR